MNYETFKASLIALIASEGFQYSQGYRDYAKANPGENLPKFPILDYKEEWEGWETFRDDFSANRPV